MCSNPDPHTPKHILTPMQTHPEGPLRHMLQHTGAFECAGSHPLPLPISGHTSTHQLRALGPHHQPPTSPSIGILTWGALVGAQGIQGSHVGDPEDARPALPAPPRSAWPRSQGTETSSRLGWARRAWTHRRTQRLPCCFAKPSQLWSGREGPGQLASTPSSWAGPGARLDFNLSDHHPCWGKKAR